MAEGVYDFGGWISNGQCFPVEVLHGDRKKSRLSVNGILEVLENCWGQALGAYYCPCVVPLKDWKI